MAAQRILVVLLALFAPAAVFPQETNREAGDVTVFVRPNFYAGESDGLKFRRTGLAAGITLRPLRRIELTAALGGGRTTLLFAGEPAKGVALGADLSAPFDLCFESRAGVTAWSRGRFSLQVFGGLEASAAGSKLRVDRAVLLTNYGDPQSGASFDASAFAREHSAASYSWSRLAAGTGFDVRLGPLKLGLAAGFERLNGSFELRLDEKSRDVLGSLGYDAAAAETRRTLDRTAVFVSPTLRLDVPAGLAVELGGSIAPFGKTRLFGASVSLSWTPRKDKP